VSSRPPEVVTHATRRTSRTVGGDTEVPHVPGGASDTTPGAAAGGYVDFYRLAVQGIDRTWAAAHAAIAPEASPPILTEASATIHRQKWGA
jgi:hypothetical protein